MLIIFILHFPLLYLFLSCGTRHEHHNMYSVEDLLGALVSCRRAFEVFQCTNIPCYLFTLSPALVVDIMACFSKVALLTFIMVRGT